VTALAQTGSARARKILNDGRLISGLNLDIADNMALKADGSAMEMMGRFGDLAPVLTLPACAHGRGARDMWRKAGDPRSDQCADHGAC
jgi:hypothetical protein